MKKVKFVRDGATEGSVIIGIDTGECVAKYQILRTEYARCGAPSAGEEIEEDTFDRIAAYGDYHKATKKALSLLSYADNNEKNLIRKLRIAGYSYDISAAVARDMVMRGYINEEDQLTRLITREANDSLRGPNKIFEKLMAKGYASADIRRVLLSLTESGEINFKENAKRLISKKLPEDAKPEEKKTLLYKNGYKL